MRSSRTPVVVLVAIVLLSGVMAIWPGSSSASVGGTWVQNNTGLGMALEEIAYDGAKYVGITDGPFGGVQIATSEFADSWTPVSIVTPQVTNGGGPVAFATNGTTYALVKGTGASQELFTSNDLMNWTNRISAQSVAIGLRDLCWCGGQFVAVGESNNQQMLWTSPDGSVWTMSSAPNSTVILGGGMPAYFTNIAYMNGRYFASSYWQSSFASTLWSSTDLVTWSEWDPSNLWSSAYFVSFGGSTHVFTGGNGQARHYVTADGATWTSQSWSQPVAGIDCATSAGGSMLVDTTSSGLLESSDGTNWTVQTLQGGNQNPGCSSFADNGADVIMSVATGQVVHINTYEQPAVTPSSQTISGQTGTAITASTSLTSIGMLGSVTYAVSAGTLPAGLQLDPTTGVISGTPSSTDSSTITIDATASHRGTASTSVTFAITAATSTTTSSTSTSSTSSTTVVPTTTTVVPPTTSTTVVPTTTTVVPPTTSTTVVPTTTTVVPPTTSTTVVPTTTTVVPPTTSTTSIPSTTVLPTTTTMSSAPPSTIAGLSSGQAMMTTIDGSMVPASMTPIANGVVVGDADFNFELTFSFSGSAANDGSLIVDTDVIGTTVGAGFQAGTSADVWMHSTPMLVASELVDGDGTFTSTFALPTDLPPGAHTLEVRGVDTNGVARAIAVGVTVRAVSALPMTGSNVSEGLAAGIGIGILGMVLVLLERLRRREPSN